MDVPATAGIARRGITAESVYAVHQAAAGMEIPSRQIITNGFFSRDREKIKGVAGELVMCWAGISMRQEFWKYWRGMVENRQGSLLEGA